MKYIIFILFVPVFCFGQKDFFNKKNHFTKADTLRGKLSPARTCYDVKYYNLDIKIDPQKKFIEGYVDMSFEAVEKFLTLQVDLFANMKMEKIIRLDNQSDLQFKRSYNAVFVNMGDWIEEGKDITIRMHYSGYPTLANNAPWDGGFVFAKDEENRDWIGVACEGDGASLWWPNKDHLSDEPEKMDISIAVPNSLTCVANGQLLEVKEIENNYKKFKWHVSYPINNYNVTVNIAHYAHFTDVYTSFEGEELALDYYVLDYNLVKAKTHFKQVKPTLACFEYYFGPYPFWNDGYALVETPYLGMEHQGAIAYGNQYKRGYLGGMIPEDMDFDYIIVHETGHEYFGNSISCNDHAEMWIHESFTTYMEALFVECTMGYEDAMRYLAGQRRFIKNKEPIIGPKDVNWTAWQSSDHYYKGALILNTLRHTINDDKEWFRILKSFYESNQISNINSTNFFEFITQETGRNFLPFFEQYLMYPNLPKFKYTLTKKKKGNFVLKYKWEADAMNFNMPLGIDIDGEKVLIEPTTEWQKLKLKINEKSDFKILSNLYLIEQS